MFDFATPIDRHGTPVQRRWDYIADRFGSADLLPFTISDMIFATAPCIRSVAAAPPQLACWAQPLAAERIFSARCATGISNVSTPPSTPATAVMALRYLHGGAADPPMVRTGRLRGDPYPAYDAFYKVILANQRQLLACPLHKAGDDWCCDMAHLRPLLARPQTKIPLLCSPHNPTGKVWRRDELQQMAELCERHDVRVISDGSTWTWSGGTPPYAVERWRPAAGPC